MLESDQKTCVIDTVIVSYGVKGELSSQRTDD